MAVEWYYVRDGEKQGPFAYEAFHLLAASGHLTPHDLVWRTGTKGWVRASTIDGLFAGAESVTTSDPPPIPNGEQKSDKPTLAVSIGSCITNTGRLASKKMHRVKIISVDLPVAYRAVGKEIYDSRQFETDFATIYDRLDDLSRKLADAQKPVEPKAGQTFAEQALVLAEKAKSFAQVKSLSGKFEAALRKLGRSAFETHGEAAGKGEAAKRVANLLMQVQEIDGQSGNLAGQVKVSASHALSEGSKATKEMWFANPLIVALGAAAGLLVTMFTCCGGCVLLNTATRIVAVEHTEVFGEAQTTERPHAVNERSYSSSEQVQIDGDVRLTITQEMGHLNSEKLATYLRVKESLEAKDVWEGTAANAWFLMLIPSTDWPKAAHRLGISRAEYRFATNFVMASMGVSLNESVLNEKRRELTGQGLEEY